MVPGYCENCFVRRPFCKITTRRNETDRCHFVKMHERTWQRSRWEETRIITRWLPQRVLGNNGNTRLRRNACHNSYGSTIGKTKGLDERVTNHHDRSRRELARNQLRIACYLVTYIHIGILAVRLRRADNAPRQCKNRHACACFLNGECYIE